MKTADDLHKEWMKDPEYRAEYDALEEEFSLAGALIAARTKEGVARDEFRYRKSNEGRENDRK